MTREILFTVLLTALLLSTCSNEEKTPGAETRATENSAPEMDPAGLRRAYNQYLSQRKDPMPTHQIPEAGKLYPVDEAPLDTAFFVLRQKLIDAVEEKNIFAVMEILADDIKTDFGEETGIAAFATTWELQSEEKTQQSPLWNVLANVLPNGGTFQEGGRRFVAPYIYATWPEEYAPATHAAVTGAGVRLREQPNLSSRTLTVASYDIVEFLGEENKSETISGETYPWMQIKKLDQTEGYMWGKFIDRPTGYRAGFEKRGGAWKMVFLLSGD